MSKEKLSWFDIGQLYFTEEEAEKIRGEKMDAKAREEFEGGKLDSEAAIRKAILLMATQGSSPAQKQMLEIIQKNKSKRPVANKIRCPECRASNPEGAAACRRCGYKFGGKK